MQIQAVSHTGALVQLSEDDLVLINNALNEVCHALDVREFATRMGDSRDNAERLLASIGGLCNQIEAGRQLPSAISSES